MHIVRAGETAGTVGQTLDELAGFLERTAEFRGRIGSALLYPAMLMVAATIAALAVITHSAHTNDRAAVPGRRAWSRRSSWAC